MKYESVELNGNIHLMGTQGVGKSTLLRAILFFYNANPEKLGIRLTGQKKFTEYYLPYQNSYIVYEVNRENESPFCIIMYRNEGLHALYRFVDAPFQREWIIDENGMACIDDLEIKKRIGSIRSTQVRQYNDYLNVIYGNVHEIKSKELQRYYILRSSQYQNIPKVIEKVFLNANVDSNFIKDTIVNSMEDGDSVSLSLRAFREKLYEFNQEYNDIQRWFEVNKQGENEATKRANNLIDHYQQILSNEGLLETALRNLKYAIKRTEEELPGMHKAVGDLKEEIQKIITKLNLLNEKFKEEHDSLVGKRELVKRDLKTCREEKKKYHDMNIDVLIRKDKEEDALVIKSRSLEEQIRELNSQYDNIVQKFTELIKKLESDKEKYRLTKGTEKVNAQNEYHNTLTVYNSERDLLKKELEENYKELLSEIESEIDSKHTIVNLLFEELANANNSKPYAAEIASEQEELTKLEKESQELQLSKEKTKSEIQKLRNNAELEISTLKSEKSTSILEIETSQNRLLEEKEKEQAFLDNIKGSLCEWLENENIDWENSIGKVISDDVLYSQELSPSVSDSTQSTLYGVDIDLNAISKEVRTPNMIKASIEDITNKIAELGKKKNLLQNELQTSIDKIEKKYSNKIKELNKELGKIEQRLLVIPACIEKQQSVVNDLLLKQKTEHDRIVKDVEEKKNNAIKSLDESKGKKTALESTKLKGLKKIDDDFTSKKKIQDEALKVVLNDIDNDIKLNNESIDLKIKECEANRDKQLKDEGADLSLRDKWSNELSEVNRQLEEIKKNKATIALYCEFCKKYLDKEPEFEQEKEKLNKKLESLDSKHNIAEEKLRNEISAKENKVTNDEHAIQGKEDGLFEATSFVDSDSCPENYIAISPKKTERDCFDILNNIRDYREVIAKRMEMLKKAAILFRDLFSPINTFKFPTEPNSGEEYKAYADSVLDFVTNNKINDYRQVTDKLYTDIIASIGNTFNTIQNKQSEIEKNIRDINYDFEHKGFGGVIKKIELKLDPNENDLIKELRAITDFYTQNIENLGEMTLFSTPEENEKTNSEAVKYLRDLSEILKDNTDKTELTLNDVFTLKLRVKENDNDYGFQENFKMVGSDGTDVLVKAIINIMLINVFKKKVSRNSNEFIVHCMMDEIGRLSNENIQGILKFASDRGIYVVNSSPQPHKPSLYRHLYVLTKDAQSITKIQPILSSKQLALQENEDAVNS